MAPAPDVQGVMRAQASRSALLDVVRVLLLLQGAILIANTLEAGLFAIAFSGGLTPTVLMTAAAAIAVLLSRARLDRGGRARRTVYVVEGIVLAMLGIDTALSLIVTHAAVPPVAILTRFVLPLSILALLGRVERAPISNGSAPVSAVSAQ